MSVDKTLTGDDRLIEFGLLLESFDLIFVPDVILISKEIEFQNLEKGKINVSGNVKLSFEGQCDRCLKSTPVNLDIQIDREVASPDFAAGEEEEELFDYMEGYSLDTEALLQGEITVNWPVKILCREDCKGLCPVCGHDLNEGDCGCDTFVPDPRMAVLSDIFHKD